MDGSPPRLVTVTTTMTFMPSFRFGRGARLVILIQILILLGLVILYKLYLPYRARNLAERAAAAREQQINALFRDSVAEDPIHEISVPLDGVIVKRHPQRLRATFSPRQAEFALGVPDTTTFDFRGGQHLTWSGNAHKLEASFNAGRLYCLSLEDRALATACWCRNPMSRGTPINSMS